MSFIRFWGALALIALGPARLAAEAWTPYQFQRAETYAYTMSVVEADPANSISDLRMVLDIRELAPDPETGEAFYDFSFTTTSTLSASDLQDGFSSVASMGGVYSMLAVAPMAIMFLGMAELEVGHTTDLFGAGRLEVPGKETIAGREGYLVRMIMVEEGEEALVSEMVIDPELALPLRSVTYEDGAPAMVFELTSYSR